MTWILASLLVLGVALAAGFAWYERSHPASHVLALVAALAALAALGRIAFAPIPSVKPTTDIVLLTGYALGGAPGFAVGAVGALASNLFFGQGPWTPWQMASWGLVGVLGALLASAAGRRLGRVPLAAACALAGLVYGAIMNLSLWILYSGDHTTAKLGAYFATSLPFDLAHAAANAGFCLAFGPALVAALTRYRERFTVRWRPAGAMAGAALAALVLGAAAAPRDVAAAVPDGPLRYVESARNPDGGFGAAKGGASTQLHTGWAALGLVAAGRDPAGAVRYMREHAGRLRGDVGELTRTILVLAAVRESPRSFAGRDLVRELLARRRSDGSWSRRVNSTAFAILALRAAGRPASDRRVRRAARWLARQANTDGGFNFGGRGGPSGIDDTGAAIQGLAAAGRRRGTVVRRAARFLERRQNPDGGFPLQPGGASNAQSTAWAVQGLVAAGRDPGRVRRGGSRTPLGYLRRLTQPDGAVRYSRTSTQTPVWVTSQALLAFSRQAFPLKPVARHSRATAAPAAPDPDPPAPGATPAGTEAPAQARTTAAREPEPALAATPTAPAGPPVPPTFVLSAPARLGGLAVGIVLSAVV